MRKNFSVVSFIEAVNITLINFIKAIEEMIEKKRLKYSYSHCYLKENRCTIMYIISYLYISKE